MTRMVVPVAERATYELQNLRPVKRSQPLFRVVKNDSQRITRAAMHAAHSVLHVHAVIAARAAHRAVARREDNRLALIGMHDFGFGLRSRLLFHQQKLPALPVAASLPEQEDHLQRESDFTVNILMQAVVPTCFVVQQQWRGFGLSGFVTNSQECSMLGRKTQALVSEIFRPP